jgi:hypothetical protein
MKIKRYNIFRKIPDCFIWEESEEDGEWVKYQDVEDLLVRLGITSEDINRLR